MSRPTPSSIRQHILEQSKRANVGHVGSALSVVEILCALYGAVLRVPAPSDPERDRFVLSKGHAALALYAVLHAQGWIARAQLDSYCGDATRLGVHPDHELDGVDFSTGSMGMGLGFAAGAALAARLQRSARRRVCFIERCIVQLGLGLVGGHLRCP
jgi:transketolase